MFWTVLLTRSRKCFRPAILALRAIDARGLCRARAAPTPRCVPLRARRILLCAQLKSVSYSLFRVLACRAVIHVEAAAEEADFAAGDAAAGDAEAAAGDAPAAAPTDPRAPHRASDSIPAAAVGKIFTAAAAAATTTTTTTTTTSSSIFHPIVPMQTKPSYEQISPPSNQKSVC